MLPAVALGAAGSWFVLSRARTGSQGLSLFPVFAAIAFHTRTLVTVGPIDLSDVVVFGFAGAWVLQRLMHPERRIASGPMVWLAVALWLSMLASCANGGLPSIVMLLTTVVKYMLVFFLLLNTIDTWKGVRTFFIVFGLATAVTSVLAILQFLAFYFFEVSVVGSVSRMTLLLMYEDTPLGRLLRPPGFVGSPSDLAAVLAVSLIFAIGILSGPGLQRGRKAVVFGIAVAGAALIATFSRSSWLAVLFCTALLPFVWRPAYTLHYASVLVLGGIATFLPPLSTWIDRLAIGSELLSGDLAFRISMLRGGIEGMVNRHPFIGAGLQRGHVYTPNAFEWSVHNAFAHSGVETGLVGMLIYISLFAVLAYRLFQTLLWVRDPMSKTLLRALLLALLALVILIQGDPAFHQLFIWFFFGAAEATVQTIRRDLHGQRSTAARS
jgi:hypothetical protein